MIQRFAIDTSSLVTVVLQEPGYRLYLAALTGAQELNLSAVSMVELGIVCKSRGVQDVAVSLINNLPVITQPFDATQADLAIVAFTQFGKGRHKAGLNFGDCCAYALAKSLNLPLLFKGNDFAQTDIASVLV